jgi:hypothetical protein
MEKYDATGKNQFPLKHTFFDGIVREEKKGDESSKKEMITYAEMRIVLKK